MTKKTVALIIAVLLVFSCTAVFVMADENETEILSPTYTMGDVDMNTKINVKDATAVQKHLADIILLNESQLKLADANVDGVVNVKDATYIQKIAAGLVEPMEPPKTNATDSGTEADSTEFTPTDASETDPSEPIIGGSQATNPSEDPTEEVTDPTVQPTDPTEDPTEETTEAPTESKPEETIPTTTKDPNKPIELPFIPAP